jgi:glycosyltransferase involved in cell wall biosynthesis
MGNPKKIDSETRPALVACLSPSWGGAEAAALASAETLRRRGIACAVAARAQSPVALEAQARGFACVELPAGRWLISISASWRLRQWLVSRPDCAVFCPRLRDLFVARPALIGLAGARLVAAAIFASSIERGRSALGRWIYHRVDTLIAHSQAQKTELLRRVPVPAGRVPILTPAIDLERFRPERRSEDLRRDWNLSDGELAIGAVGHALCLASGPQGKSESADAGLLQALAILVRNKPRLKWKLLVASDPAEPLAAAATEAWAREAGHRLGGERIGKIAGDASLPEFFASIDLFVSTEKAGAIDARLFEAMASGTATFAPATGAIPELIKDARASLLWRAGNPWDLARQLERAILNPTLRQRVASEGRSLARSRHDSSAYEKELLRHVLGSGPAAARATIAKPDARPDARLAPRPEARPAPDARPSRSGDRGDRAPEHARPAP